MDILFITPRIPAHLTTGDRLRAYHFVKGLAERGHQIDLLGFVDKSQKGFETDIASYCRSLHCIPFKNLEFKRYPALKHVINVFLGFCSGLPRRVYQFKSRQMVATCRRLLTGNRYDLVHFSEIGCIYLLKYCKQTITCPVVMDYVDAVSMLIESFIKNTNGIRSYILKFEASKMIRFERKMLDRINAGIFISDRDCRYIGNSDKLHVIPIGVIVPSLPAMPEKDIDLIFVGNMSAYSNKDAVLWFFCNCYPQLLKLFPHIRLYIVGRDPDNTIQQLACTNIVVTGFVRDIRDYLLRAKLFIAPLRTGAGQKIKLLDAMSYCVPVIATSEANEGIGAVDSYSIIICDKPDTMIDAVADLLNNPGKRREIAEKASSFIRNNYAWSNSINKLESIYRSLTGVMKPD